MRCPNCDCPVESSPVRCEVCGFRSEDAREYLWIYVGGMLFAVIGFVIGITGMWIQGAPPGAWTDALSGRFPIALWPGGTQHWMAFVVAGIVLTLGGLGLSRRRWLAWWTLLAYVLWQLGWTVVDLARGTGDSRAALLVVVGAAAMAVVLARIGLAMRRTPPRDVAELQRRAQETLAAAGRNESSP